SLRNTRTRIRNRTNQTHTRPIRRQARKKFQLKVALYIQAGLDCIYRHNNRRNHGTGNDVQDRSRHEPGTTRRHQRGPSGVADGIRPDTRPVRVRPAQLMPTPLRSLRIDDMRWERLLARAEKDNTTVTAILRQLIDEYLKEDT